MRSLDEIFKGENPDDCLIRWGIGVEGFKGWAENVHGLQIKPFHLEWVWALENCPRVAIQAPTGFGKSEIFSKTYPIWKSFYNENLWFLVVSNSMPQSSKLVEGVKTEILDNELLQKLIPADSWRFGSKTELDFATKCKYLCKPYSENVKGIHVNYVLGDEVSSFKDKMIWYKYVVTRATAKKGSVAAISTPETETDLISDLCRSSEYWNKIYSAENAKGESIWPERFPTSWLKARKVEIGEIAYNLQYLCNTKIPAYDSEQQPFPMKFVLPVLNPKLRFEKEAGEGVYYMAIDPAFSITGDWSAVAIGKRTPDNKIQISKLFRTKLDEQLKEFVIANNSMFHPARIVIDTSTGGSMIMRELTMKNLPMVGFSFVQENRNATFRSVIGALHSQKVVIPTSDEDMETKTMTDVLVHELTHFMRDETPTRMPTYKSTSQYDDTAIAFIMLVKTINDEQPFVSYFRAGDGRKEEKREPSRSTSHFNIDTSSK